MDHGKTGIRKHVIWQAFRGEILRARVILPFKSLMPYPEFCMLSSERRASLRVALPCL